MKHRLGTSTILITAATTLWRTLLTQWKKKLTAHLCNVDCFVCSWLISERKWTCANVRVRFWNVEDPDSSPSSGWLRQKLLLLFQYISVFQPYLSAAPQLRSFQLPNLECALTKPSSLDHWTHAMRLTSCLQLLLVTSTLWQQCTKACQQPDTLLNSPTTDPFIICVSPN